MKSITDGRSTRWQKHRDQRRRELLRAVRLVVDEYGDELSMDQISEHSGTTKSVLYRYFTDRAGLQAAMGEWAMGVIVRSLDDARPREPPRADVGGVRPLGVRRRSLLGHHGQLRLVEADLRPPRAGAFAEDFVSSVSPRRSE